MKKIKLLLITAVLSTRAFAQCQEGETEITIVAHSYDVWGEESYWELVPAGNGCGNGSLLTGGSEEVGCAGNGPTGENGIPDFGSETMSVCVATGTALDLVWVDWYGDGGLTFDIYMDGIYTSNYWGGGLGNTWTIIAGEYALPDFDSPCGALAIEPNGPSVIINTEACVAPYEEPAPAGLSCGLYGFWCEGVSHRSGWLWFIPEEGASYQISACNAATTFDTQIAVWSASDCQNPGSFQLITSNDDSQVGCGGGNGYASTCFVSCLDPGQVYYIMIDGWEGQAGNAEVTITTYDGTSELQTQVNDVICPLGEGQAPTGSIWPQITGTGADFACTWTGPGGFSSTDHFIFNLGPGEYSLTATTNCGEVFTGTYTIGLPDPWDVTMSHENASCPQAEDGYIEVTASGATPGYYYYFDGPGTAWYEGTANSTSCSAGDYLVTVVDSRNCTYAQEVFVDYDDDLLFDLGPDTNTLCLGEELLISGPGGLNYLWQDGSTNQFYVINADEWGVGTFALILTASSDDGCSHTDAMVFNVESCVGVSESDAYRWTIFPNPTTNDLFIQGEQAMIGMDYRIVDATGRFILAGQFSADQTRIPSSALESGIYLIYLSDGSSMRFVKQ